MNISDFFNEEYIQYAIYDSYRSIANFIDGLKPSMRKVVYTFQENNITNKEKVAQVQSTIAKKTLYIHGENSLGSVIINMAKNYTGANNINLLDPNGNFGSRFINDAAATRYIYTKKSKAFDSIFNKLDASILDIQHFEGEKIEPKFFVPILPLLLINGSEGIGNGYAQKILPRNPKELEKYIISKLNNKKSNLKLLPYYKGFKGTIEQDSENLSKFFLKGKLNIKNTTTIEITEVPINYQLENYLSVLDKLIEDKVIKDYDDRSNKDNFHFIIKCTREFIDKNTEEELYSIFKLVKPITENYTSIGPNNEIIEFNSIFEIIDQYISIRLDYYIKRKQWIIDTLSQKLNKKVWKFKFIKAVLDGTIVINKKSKKDIEGQLQKNSFPQEDGNWNYLLSMPIYSLTKETITELGTEIKKIKEEIDTIKKKDNTTLWLEDLKNIGSIYE